MDLRKKNRRQVERHPAIPSLESSCQVSEWIQSPITRIG